MIIIEHISSIVTLIFGILLLHKFLYIFLGIFTRGKKYKNTDIKPKYAVLIPARNEELVIGNLIKSIKSQSYDPSLITIFVVADNCVDNTANKAREEGAIVYERNGDKYSTKGYGLKFLMENIKRDYGISSFDYYAVFDSDNVLDVNFFEEMNKSLATGLDVCMGFRNTKNFSQNVISSGYAFHFYYNNIHRNRACSILGTSPNITGTGVVIKNDCLLDGWKYVDLTEDLSMSMDLVAQGKSIGYNDKAMFFDEQPTKVSVAWTQRLRWKRGSYYSFFHYFKDLFLGSFKVKGAKKKFSCYDIFVNAIPYDTLSNVLIIMLVIGYAVVGIQDADYTFTHLWIYIGRYFLSLYLSYIFFGIVILIKDRKIIFCAPYKKILYLITYPFFYFLSLPLSIVAIFKKVRWEPVKHKINRNLDEIKIDVAYKKEQ